MGGLAAGGLDVAADAVELVDYAVNVIGISLNRIGLVSDQTKDDLVAENRQGAIKFIIETVGSVVNIKQSARQVKDLIAEAAQDDPDANAKLGRIAGNVVGSAAGGGVAGLARGAARGVVKAGSSAARNIKPSLGDVANETQGVTIATSRAGSTGTGEITSLATQVRESGGTLAIQRGQISAQDIAAASKGTGNEFAMFRDRDSGQLFVRELGKVNGQIPENTRLIIHSQPGSSPISVIPSPDDRIAIKALGQRSSVIINETGEFGLRFGTTPTTDNAIIPLRLPE